MCNIVQCVVIYVFTSLDRCIFDMSINVTLPNSYAIVFSEVYSNRLLACGIQAGLQTFHNEAAKVLERVYRMMDLLFAGSLESANSSILAARRHFKEVVGKKIRILL